MVLLLLSFKSLKLPSNLASQISKLYKLTHLQEIAVAILLQNCAKEDIKKSSKDFLRQKLADLKRPVLGSK